MAQELLKEAASALAVAEKEPLALNPDGSVDFDRVNEFDGRLLDFAGVCEAIAPLFGVEVEDQQLVWGAMATRAKRQLTGSPKMANLLRPEHADEQRDVHRDMEARRAAFSFDDIEEALAA